MNEKEKSRGRNPIPWGSVIPVAIIVATIIMGFSIGFPLLSSRITGVETSLGQQITTVQTSLDQRINDLNASLSDRINTLPELVAVAPLPVPAKLPSEKLKEIPKSALLTAERGEEVVTVTAGGYVVLPVQFTLGETATIEWQVVGENFIDFYLLDQEGNVYRFSRTMNYSSIWMSPDDATFYLYFSNTFDPTKPKSLWIRLVESG